MVTTCISTHWMIFPITPITDIDCGTRFRFLDGPVLYRVQGAIPDTVRLCTFSRSKLKVAITSAALMKTVYGSQCFHPTVVEYHFSCIATTDCLTVSYTQRDVYTLLDTVRSADNTSIALSLVTLSTKHGHVPARRLYPLHQYGT